MSTVAYRHGVLCADRQGTNGSTKYDLCKLATQDGVSIAWVGAWVDGRKFADWYFAGRDMDALPEFINTTSDNPPDFRAIVMAYEGCDEWGPRFVPAPIGDHDFTAIGSGQKAAMAAMHMGADAERAVHITHLVDCYTSEKQDVARRGETN